MTEDIKLSEDLLDAWLNISMKLWNERLVKYMSYNEALVCHLLYKQKLEQPENPCLTLMQLSKATGILKSQMNKTLSSLEASGFITRKRSRTDKRIVYIYMEDSNINTYLEEHQHILGIVNEVISRIGPDKSSQAIDIFNEIADKMSDVTTKG